MNSELVATKILLWFGEVPEAYPHVNDKWPAIFAIVIFYSIPVILALAFLAPLVWIWVKKKKWTLRNIAKALLQGVGLVLVTIFLLFYLAAYFQGKAFEALNGIS